MVMSCGHRQRNTRICSARNEGRTSAVRAPWAADPSLFNKLNGRMVPWGSSQPRVTGQQ